MYHNIFCFSNRDQYLHAARNYYSLTAVLQGLIAAGVQTPSSLRHLIDSSGNYEGYHKTQEVNPGLAFLFPHVRIIQHHTEAAMRLLRARLSHSSHIQAFIRHTEAVKRSVFTCLECPEERILLALMNSIVTKSVEI